MLPTVISVCMIDVLSLNYTKENSVITLISNNTRGIFFVHYILVHIVWKMIPKLDVCHTLLASIVVGTGVLFVSLGIVLILKKIPIIKECI